MAGAALRGVLDVISAAGAVCATTGDDVAGAAPGGVFVADASPAVGGGRSGALKLTTASNPTGAVAFPFDEEIGSSVRAFDRTAGAVYLTIFIIHWVCGAA